MLTNASAFPNLKGIPPHCDTHSAFQDGIVVLSMGSDIVMEWCHHDTGEKLQRSVLIPRRSVTVMSGDSRYGWSHGITSRKTDIVRCTNGNLTTMKRGLRISFTFRWQVLHSNLFSP